MEVALYAKLCFDNKRYFVNDISELASNKSIVLQGVTVQPRLAMNWRSFCFSLPSADITGMHTTLGFFVLFC